MKPRPDRGFWGVLKDRFVSFTMVLGVGFLLLVSMIAGAALSAVVDHIGISGTLARLIDVGVGLAATIGLFALIFRVVPDAKVPWRDALVGATFTAVLFAIGRLLLAIYLSRSSVASSYGAAGSVVAVLVWVYYTAQIMFLGAELTQVWASRHGHHIEPDRDAIKVTEEDKPFTPSGHAQPAH